MSSIQNFVGYSSKSLSTLESALRAFECNDIQTGKKLLHEVKQDIPEIGLRITHLRITLGEAKRCKYEVRADENDDNLLSQETARAIKTCIRDFLNDPCMKMQGTSEICPITLGSCPSYYNTPEAKRGRLVHVLTPSGVYVHALQFNRVDPTERNEISFRDPKPFGYSNYVLKAIPNFDYCQYGYEKKNYGYVRWVDPNENNMMPLCKQEQRPSPQKPILQAATERKSREDLYDDSLFQIIAEGALTTVQGGLTMGFGVFESLEKNTLKGQGLETIGQGALMTLKGIARFTFGVILMTLDRSKKN